MADSEFFDVIVHDNPTVDDEGVKFHFSERDELFGFLMICFNNPEEAGKYVEVVQIYIPDKRKGEK